MQKNTKDFSTLKKKINFLNSHDLFKKSEYFTHAELKVFMSYHVYAVWDFMSIVKCLQNHTCPSTFPWKPNKYTKNGIAHLINEIIYSEESDVDEAGNYFSHFDLYIMAMDDVGADTSAIKNFIANITTPLKRLENNSDINIPIESKDFVNNTFECLSLNNFANTAAIFTYGRETTIPDMFSKILNKINKNQPEFAKLRLYIKRHIDIDSSRHGPLSLKLFEYAYNNNQDKYDEAIKFAIKSIDKRINLWDGVYNKIKILR